MYTNFQLDRGTSILSHLLRLPFCYLYHFYANTSKFPKTGFSQNRYTEILLGTNFHPNTETITYCPIFGYFYQKSCFGKISENEPDFQIRHIQLVLDTIFGQFLLKIMFLAMKMFKLLEINIICRIEIVLDVHFQPNRATSGLANFWSFLTKRYKSRPGFSNSPHSNCIGC